MSVSEIIKGKNVIFVGCYGHFDKLSDRIIPVAEPAVAEPVEAIARLWSLSQPKRRSNCNELAAESMVAELSKHQSGIIKE